MSIDEIQTEEQNLEIITKLLWFESDNTILGSDWRTFSGDRK